MNPSTEPTTSTDTPAVDDPPAAEVCIVGAGPAGLILANELVDRGHSVILLESGPPDGSAQDLSRGDVDGDPINALHLELTRHRGIGGNANAWLVKTERRAGLWDLGVRYGPQTELALGDRPWIPLPGWPIASDEVLRWSRRAHELLSGGAFDHDTPGTSSPDIERDRPHWTDSDWLDRRYFSFGPRNRFLIDLSDNLRRNRLVRIIEDATVTRLHQETPGAPVHRLTYRPENGHQVELRVNRVVLACGGIENARLLLASETSRGGIGNETSNVGRYFMDHPLWAIGDLRLHDPRTLMENRFFDFRTVDGSIRHGHLVTNRAWCEANEAVEIAVSLFPRPQYRAARSIENLKYLTSNPRHYATHPKELLDATSKLVGGLPHLPRAALLARRQSVLPGFGRGGWSDAPPNRWFRELEVVFMCEQPPLPDSRVTLSERRDRLGSPLAKVTWRLGRQTEDSALSLQRLMVELADANGVGRYTPRSGSLDTVPVPTSIAHHMGTTRMSTSADHGVVGPDSRVHSCPNLFIAGSSVFPVGGYVNPTLTIAALTMRLAETISRDLRSPTID